MRFASIAILQQALETIGSLAKAIETRSKSVYEINF